MRSTLKVLAWTTLSITCLLVAVAIWWVYIGSLQPARRGCPLLAWLKPIEKYPILPGDFLEITWGGGYGGGIGTIRIFGDGRIERDTTIRHRNGVIDGCPLRAEDRIVSIPPPTAIALITKARDQGFCRLCAYYFPGERVGVSDAPTTTITLHTGAITHRVSDHAGSPPALYRELLHEIDTATPPFPPYANWRTQSHEDEESCLDFEKKQEIINARIEGRRPYF